MPHLYNEHNQATFIHAFNVGDSIELKLVDAQGNFVDHGHILAITGEGRLHLSTSINKVAAKLAGLKLDADGSVELERKIWP